MSNSSLAIVSFLANLLPLYDGESHEGHGCARSLSDGTLILPVAESVEDDEVGWIRVRWQGDAAREQVTRGDMFASVALERYVRLHGVGHGERSIANELWFMARHFQFKTGCSTYFPELPEPTDRLDAIGRKAREMGQGVLVNLISKVIGV